MAPRTPTKDPFRNIIASLAGLERRVICEGLSNGDRRKVTEDAHTGGWLPYGYRRADDAAIAVVPE